MGNESLSIVQAIFANNWFKGKELAFALAVTMSVGRLGSTLNNLLMPVIAQETSLGWALTFGLVLIIMSYFWGLMLLQLENIAKKHEDQDSKEEIQENEKVDWSYVKDFPLSYWIINVNCVTIYISLFMFMNISNDFIMEKYSFSLTAASRLTSVIFMTTAVLCIVFGIITDKIGYRVSQIIYASFLLLSAHIIFLTASPCHQCYISLFPLMMIGVSFSIYTASLWTMLPIVIKEEYLGTAFGITLAIQNCGLGFGPNIVGILQSKHGYDSVFIFFIIVSAIGIISGLWLYFINLIKHDNLLQLPSSDVVMSSSTED